MTRQALIVLGMHRSGTSAVSGVLAKIGVQAPKSLMPPTPANPRGYWESVALMGFHDRILESAGTDWSDWGKFNESWIDSSEAEDFQRDLSTLLDEEYGNSRLFLVKDPRMCRLLPFWIRALRNLDIAPKAVIAVRHPDEVSLSLAARDHFGKNQSRLIWLRNMLDVEFSSRGIPRVFIRYSDLLRDWRSPIHKIASQLDIKWPRWSGSVEADIEAYLSPELRHYVSPETASSPSTDAAAWVAESYRSLDSVMDGNAGAEVLQRLDNIRKEFDRTSAIYAPVVHEHRNQSIQKEEALVERLAASSTENDRLKAAIAQLNENYQARQASHEAMASQVADLTDRIQRRESDHSELESGYGAKLVELESKHRDAVSKLRDEINAQKAENWTAQRTIAHRFAEVAKLSALVLELEDKLGTLQDEAHQLNADLLDEKRVSLAKNARILALEEIIEEYESKFRMLDHELDAKSALIHDYRSRLEQVQSNKIWKIATRLGRIARRDKTPLAMEKQESDNDLLRHSGLFDGSWYLRKYPSVRAKRMEPILHYLEHGAMEGYDPSPVFSTNAYKARYPDVAVAGVNPLVHYIKYGRQEGRILSTNPEIGNGQSKPAADN
jgi:hypothetical protein